ncbi:MAG: DoxX family protein [Opitutaceae bacterium]|nr:DoxX family protein [Opitutaceae bacterium]
MAAHTASPSFTRFFPAIARVLLGLMFFVFGLNGFLFFIPPPPPDQMPAGLVAFSTAMMNTGYLFQLVKATETLMGALLLLNRFVPLALTILAPVIVNIVAVHVFLAPSGVVMALVILALELYLAWSYRSAFRPMLAARVTPG